MFDDYAKSYHRVSQLPVVCSHVQYSRKTKTDQDIYIHTVPHRTGTPTVMIMFLTKTLRRTARPE